MSRAGRLVHKGWRILPRIIIIGRRGIPLRWGRRGRRWWGKAVPIAPTSPAVDDIVPVLVVLLLFLVFLVLLSLCKLELQGHQLGVVLSVLRVVLHSALVLLVQPILILLIQNGLSQRAVLGSVCVWSLRIRSGGSRLWRCQFHQAATRRSGLAHVHGAQLLHVVQHKVFHLFSHSVVENHFASLTFVLFLCHDVRELSREMFKIVRTSNATVLAFRLPVAVENLHNEWSNLSAKLLTRQTRFGDTSKLAVAAAVMPAGGGRGSHCRSSLAPGLKSHLLLLLELLQLLALALDTPPPLFPLSALFPPPAVFAQVEGGALCLRRGLFGGCFCCCGTSVRQKRRHFVLQLFGSSDAAAGDGSFVGLAEQLL
eukprot:m.221005 g.221005  ORF g.221005 m.221005 type:complete len:369 (-) comp22283_c0_seq2:2030-3136(-)